MRVLLDAPVERAAVFRANQRLRRTRALGHVSHIELMMVNHSVEVAAALFLSAKPMHTLDGIVSKGL